MIWVLIFKDSKYNAIYMKDSLCLNPTTVNSWINTKVCQIPIKRFWRYREELNWSWVKLLLRRLDIRCHLTCALRRLGSLSGDSLLQHFTSGKDSRQYQNEPKRLTFPREGPFLKGDWWMLVPGAVVFSPLKGFWAVPILLKNTEGGPPQYLAGS